MNLFFIWRLAIMILMRGKDIMRAIGGVGLKVEPALGPEITQATPHIKIITAKRHIKKQVNWYFNANEIR